MLKSGYFTTRKEIIDWINSTLHLNITKIEQLGAGNIYCHILDAAFPAKVPMHRVKWNAQTEIDFLFNFKILQNCFEHLGIARHIEVQKLVKAKCQDNLELIQWMKFEFSQQIKNNHGYDPLRRRSHAKISLAFAEQPQKNRQNKSTVNLANYFSNKENSNIQNIPQTPRLSNISIKDHRKSLGILTHRPNQEEEPSKDKRNTFMALSIQSKTDQALLERPKPMRNSGRMHTESGGVIISKRLYTEFILQTDEEECF